MNKNANKNWTKEQLLEIEQQFKSGKSPREVGLNFSTTEETIRNVLKKLGCYINRTKMKDKWSQEKVEDIKTMYLNGIYAEDIGKKYNIDQWKIVMLLKQLGIYKGKADRRFITRKYTINENYFDKIDTEEKAYWLGFLYADGCNTEKYRVSISLNSKDKYILEKFKVSIGSSQVLSDMEIKRNGKIYYAVKLDINSKKIANSLKLLGMVKAKSLILKWPTFLGKDLIRHFIRGYFDGDGSWHIVNKTGKKKAITFSMCGSEFFTNGLMDYLYNMHNFAKVKLDKTYLRIDGVKQLGRDTAYVYRKSGVKQAERFFDLIYKDATIYLERKYKKAKDFLYPEKLLQLF